MVDDDRIAVGGQWDEDGRAFLAGRIGEFNAAATGVRDGGGVSCVVRDAEGAVVAGLFGWTWGGCLEVESLWVREDRRGRGYGTRLLAAAEAEARARGCTQAVLATHSFQAPGFYGKMGYEVVGVVEDYPVGHRKLHLRKRLG
jgi:GNAT superfamily N-acetyltransferase